MRTKSTSVITASGNLRDYHFNSSVYILYMGFCKIISLYRRTQSIIHPGFLGQLFLMYADNSSSEQSGNVDNVEQRFDN